MQKTKRLLAFILITVFTITQLPLTVLGDGTIDGGGEIISSGTLPEETVYQSVYPGTSLEEVTTGTVTAFEELPDEIRRQNTTAPIFPDAVSGTVEGKIVQIPVTWHTEQEYDENTPQRGLYVFDAVPGKGYTLAEGVEPPRITVFIPESVGRFRLFSMSGSGSDASPLEITTAVQLAEVAELVNSGSLESFVLNDPDATVSFKLMNDLDLAGYGS